MTAPGMRTCGRCGAMFPADDLRRTKSKRGGVLFLCVPCLRVWRRLKVKVR